MKGKKILTLLCCLSVAGSVGACKGGSGEQSSSQGGGQSGASDTEKVLQLAEEKEWVDITTYNAASLPAYMQPIWYTREVYDETVVFVGENSTANLLYQPKGKVTVRNYQLNVTYEEGRDYTIEGKTITRVEGGQMPYFEVDDYYLKTAGSVSIGVHAGKCEFDFDENRYLYYGEGTSLTKNHISISYKTDDMWTGVMPDGKTDCTEKFMNKVKTEKKASIAFYGDSITVGCNASGTSYGGNVNPYLPSWSQLIADWFSYKYGAEITLTNKAVGGWQVKDGFSNFNKDIQPIAAQTDCLVLAFGMNDSWTKLEDYRDMTNEMVSRYLSENPNGTVILVSPMNPNTQSTWVGNQAKFEAELDAIAESYDSVAVAPVNTMFTEFENMGKRTRDWLANNINHPNDFGVRAYAQIILKTLAGDEFFKEIYK